MENGPGLGNSQKTGGGGHSGTSLAYLEGIPFGYGRIGEIRPLILLDLGRAIFWRAPCHCRHLLVDVADDAALLLELPV